MLKCCSEPFRSNDCQKGGASLASENGHTTKKPTPGAPTIVYAITKKGAGVLHSYGVASVRRRKWEFREAATRVRARETGIYASYAAGPESVHTDVHTPNGLQVP